MCYASIRHTFFQLAIRECRAPVSFIWVLWFSSLTCSGVSYGSMCTTVNLSLLVLLQHEVPVCCHTLKLRSSFHRVVSNCLYMIESRCFALVLVGHYICLEKSYFCAVNNEIFHYFIFGYALLDRVCPLHEINEFVWINSLSISLFAASPSYACKITVYHWLLMKIEWTKTISCKTVHTEDL